MHIRNLATSPAEAAVTLARQTNQVCRQRRFAEGACRCIAGCAAGRKPRPAAAGRRAVDAQDLDLGIYRGNGGRAIGLGFYLLNGIEPAGKAPGAVAATFVGSDTCAGCHQAEAKLWGGSHHKQAMDHATDKSVLGDFNDASFDHYGVRSRFFRKDGKFLVETDGPDGKLATFEVKYTFGVYPLQQYLIEFPDGRVQALSIAWDSRPKEQGGQRWFHLYPNEEIKHDDVLHWTKLNQNWNFMCAECHSTGVRKNYDAANDRYATTFAEISVGCEACHGAGSRHVGWAQERQRWSPVRQASDDPSMGLVERFTERRDGTWTRDAATGNANRSSAPRTLRAEVETCGRCHARRGEFSEDWVPGQWLSDTHTVSPLGRGLYHADGQMLDEVYNYGSFKQSKMFAAGVTCSDCHEPHGAKLRVPGDGVCLQCHSSDKYAAVAHHQHAEVNPPLSCASCHMPTRTYMVVDPRHDHSLRIPRPDLSAKLGTPNACNDCHTDKSADWAASAIERWHGPEPEGFSELRRSIPCRMDRSGGCGEAACGGGRRSKRAGDCARHRADRAGPAGFALERQPGADRRCRTPIRWCGSAPSTCSKMCRRRRSGRSPRRCSPIPAAACASAPSRLLAAVPTASQPPADRDRFERAAAEFIAAQRLNADRPEARSALGSFFAKRGRAADAEAEYKAALRLEPAICARCRQPGRSLPGTRAGSRRRERAAGRTRPRRRRMRGCIMRSA